MANLALMHQWFRGEGTLYFYEGSVPVIDGIAVIPEGFEHWAHNAWLKGYRLDPETGEEIVPGTIDDLMAPAPVVRDYSGDRGEVPSAQSAPESAKSDEGTDDEGSDLGGQPTEEDGLREGEQPRGEGVPEPRAGGRSRRGA